MGCGGGEETLSAPTYQSPHPESCIRHPSLHFQLSTFDPRLFLCPPLLNRTIRALKA